jgi:hypothetical protein
MFLLKSVTVDRMKRICVAVVLALALSACGASGDEPDSAAFLACRSFRSMADDVNAGRLAVTELRGKIQGIESNASVSEEPGIARGASDMLAAATASDDRALSESVTSFEASCTAAGA